jgi:folate-dependent phosphoribosylglycinamide formyltransferase PurN
LRAPGGSHKRLVILTGQGAAHRYVANALCAAFDVEMIVVDARAPAIGWRRALRRGVLTFIGKLGRALFLKLTGDGARRARAARRLLPGSDDFIASEKVRLVDGVNSAEAIALIRACHPDVLLVYGTGVVKRKVLKLAGEATLNLHTGVSPDYRGTACAFWPVVNGEFDKIGSTVHECVAALDGGRIYEVVRVEVEATDDLGAIFARCVAAGTAAYVRVVRRYLAGDLHNSSQDLALGREYSGVELTLWPELKARWRLLVRRRALARHSKMTPRPARPRNGSKRSSPW